MEIVEDDPLQFKIPGSHVFCRQHHSVCLLYTSGFVLILGVGVFTYRYIAHGDDWASYEGNLDVYARGDLSKGSLYDTNGQILMKNTSSGMEFNENADVRKALMHVTGDKDNNITTGANRAFTDELIGYNLINGVYSLNNAGKDVTMTLDANVCACLLYTSRCV